MTSRLRGSAKEEPKSTSLVFSKSRNYLGSATEPRDESNFEISRKKVSRKDSRGKYDDFSETNNDRYETNGYKSPPDDVDDEEDPDFLYRRSRDHFGSWNIKDIIGEKNQTPIFNDEISKYDRKSRFDSFKSNGFKGEKINNGNSRSKHKSLENPESEFNHRRFDSSDRKHSRSRSPDRDRDRYKLNKKNNAYDETRIKSPTKDSDRIVNPPYYDEQDQQGYRPKKNRALLQEIENFGSNGRRLIKTNESPERIERRYAGNISPGSENDKIRLLIDKFKSNDRNNECQESLGRKSAQRHRSPSRENDKYKIQIRSEDGFGSIDRNLSNEKSENWQDTGKYSSLDRKASHYRKPDDNENEKWWGSMNRKWKENNGEKYGSESFERKERKHCDSEIQNDKSLERRKQKSKTEETEGGFRKRSDTYSLEHSVRQNVQDSEKDEGRETSSKRRSYVYSGSPDKFDVQIQKYERALPGPRKDPELSKKTEVKRRSSVKIKDETNERQEKNGRHNRPLTPPYDDNHKFSDRRTNFNTKDWYETNKQFAVKYLQENSKLRSSANDDIEVEFGEDEIRNGSPIREPREIYFGPDRRNEPLAFHQKQTSSFRIEPEEESNERNTDSKLNRKSMRNSKEIDQPNTAGNKPITIKIRNVLEDHSENERRAAKSVLVNNEKMNSKSRRRYEDHSPKRDGRGNRDKEWTSASTPARKIWSYRDGV